MSPDWQHIRLSSIATYSQGTQVPPDEQQLLMEDGFGRFVRIIDFTNESEPPRFIKNPSQKYYVDDVDIVMIRYGSQTAGKVVRGISGFIANNMFKVNINSEIADSSFVYRFLSTEYIFNYLRGTQSSSTMPAITFGMMDSIELNLPPKSTQKSIACFFDNLDDRIALLRETNATLEAIAQAMFKSWFVDFDPVHAKQQGRAPEGMGEVTAALFPDSFEESELGLVPMGWNVGNLGDILSLRNERVKSTEETALLPYVPIECISSKTPFLENFKSGEDANSSLILFKKGDVLFGAMRPYFHKVCIAPFDGVTRTTAFTLKTNNDKCSAYGLFLAFQESTIQYATQHSEGSTIPYAKWTGSLEKMPIVVPDVALQEIFSDVVGGLISKANEGILQAQTLATLRDTLLPRLISGQLRLPEAINLIDEVQHDCR